MQMSWKDRCNMQMKAFVQAAMTVYGCTEEEAYEVVFKGLCSNMMFELAEKNLEKR